MPERIATRLSHRLGNEGLQQHLGIKVLVGFALIALGLVGILQPATSALPTMRLIGLVLMGGGICQVTAGLRHLHEVLLGCANLLIGACFLIMPRASSMTLSLVLAGVYVVVGLFKTVTSLRKHGEHWQRNLALGMTLVVLGTLITLRWPDSGTAVIGRFIGVQLVVEGVTWLMVLRNARQPRITMAPEVQEERVPR